MSAVITTKKLTKIYNHTKAVDSLNLSVDDGEFFGFLGPNGAGKTTTIRMLTGTIRPDDGEMSVGNFDQSDKEHLAQIIGVMPESRGFYDWMTGQEYLEFFAHLYKLDKNQQKERIKALLTQVDLTARKDTKISTYSRGMKQRLGLARALVNNPKILFLDEPTLGLDPQGQQTAHDLLKQLNHQGVTVFFSSHLLSEVTTLCSRVAIINHGKLIAEGTIDELRKQTNLADSNLTDIFLTLTQN
jgi:ABC-type multidrug transport system ATPase subunit